LGSSEFLNNVTTTKDGAREVGHIFTVADPSRSVVVGHSADSG
jgi:L-arabinose isomerase